VKKTVLLTMAIACLAIAAPNRNDTVPMPTVPEYVPAKSNNSVVTSGSITTYHVIDTTVIYKATLKINNVSLLTFPTRVKLAVIGNTAEFKTTVENNMVYVKPLIMNTSSNLHVTLYSGEVISMDLTSIERGDKFNERMIFNYPEVNPILSFANDLTNAMRQKQHTEMIAQKEELSRTLPQDFMRDLIVYRCDEDRDETSLKYQGYQVTFDACVSNKQYTYFYFHTNASKNEACPVSNIDKIEVKTKTRERMPIELQNFVNTGDFVIVRTPVISDKPEEMKLFITVKFFNVQKTMKVYVY